MNRFALCAECAREYLDPADRRFHAQPNACPKCGPHLELWDAAGAVLAARDPALLQAAQSLRNGKILALKGIGGFQLMVDARNADAVRRLRQRKQREEKPFALMYPSLQSVRADCRISPAEAGLLQSPESPIVLLERLLPSNQFAIRNPQSAIAPSNPNLGVMLPYSPLHHLLMFELQFPVVATSGNLSDEPICIDEHESLQRLRDIADVFLVHNRPIVRHLDDSVARVVLGREQILRRARGYAPLPVRLADRRPAPAPDSAPPVLAVGAHLKNTIALAVGPQVFVSQHIGDLETVQSYEAFLRVISDFERLYETVPATIACDAHPDYLSTQFAASLAARKPGLRVVSVQHHIAHVLACAAENELAPPVLGVSWDGTGHGLDGTVWGGEFFLLTDTACRRVGHLRQFRLPGGDQAVREPRRAALGMLYELFAESAPDLDGSLGSATVPVASAGVSPTESARPFFEALPPVKSFAGSELAGLTHMLKSGVNSPLTSSAGRLFDAVAALAGLRQTVRFEGQAAMELEFAIAGLQTDESYSYDITPRETPTGESLLLVDWAGIARGILSDLKREVSIALISAKFHNTLAEVIVAVAKRCGHPQVALSGGCFQNRYLTERAATLLAQEGFRPYWHQHIPPNDGGIAFGQIVAALMGSE
jgi:hydrogenase maturation protein HypF